MDAVKFAVQQKICSAVISMVEDCEYCDGIWIIASPAARHIIATTQNNLWPGWTFLISCLVKVTWIYCVRRVAEYLRPISRYGRRLRSIIARRCDVKKAIQTIKW